jgi:hypothetical protein
MAPNPSRGPVSPWAFKGGSMRLSPAGPLGERLDRSRASDQRPSRTKPSCGKANNVGGWTETRPVSLGLLPSGPDPVGEWCVHRQPPIVYLDRPGEFRNHLDTGKSGAHASATRLVRPMRRLYASGAWSLGGSAILAGAFPPPEQTVFRRRTTLDERAGRARQQRKRENG